MQATVASKQSVAETLATFCHLILRPRSPATIALMRTLADLDLTLPQVKLLGFLEDLGEVSVKQLADDMHLSLPAVSRAVDGLVQRGLVDRWESPTDRRSKIVRLSPAGHEVIERAMTSRVRAFEELLETFSDEERTALHAALVPIVERIRNQ